MHARQSVQMKSKAIRVGSSPSASGKGTISKHAYHVAKTYSSQPGSATTDIGAANTVQFTDADFAETGIPFVSAIMNYL